MNKKAREYFVKLTTSYFICCSGFTLAFLTKGIMDMFGGKYGRILVFAFFIALMNILTMTDIYLEAVKEKSVSTP